MTRRAAVLAEQRLAASGRGGPPCAYAFAVLGSAGRAKACWPWIRTTPWCSPRALSTARGSLVCGAGRACCRHPARSRRALLHRRCDGTNPRLARFARDLAGARRRLDRPLASRRTCFRSTSSSICVVCTAMWRLTEAAMAGGLRSAGRPASRSPSCWPRRRDDGRA